MDDDTDPASAIHFGTDGWRATLETFTDERVRMVGQAVATHLADHDDPVAVGYDAREHSRGFAEELTRVLAASGLDVLVPDRDVPTPVVAWSVLDRDLAGALMVTASHNPPEYNGVKFVPDDGAPALPAVTDELAADLAPPDPAPESEWGTVREVDLLAPYREHALAFADADLDGLTVVYDAMHGSGRGVTDDLLDRAGATVYRRRCERDPEFGGSAPEPTADHLGGLVAAVDEHDADLGVANDGDADRLALVTPERGVLDRNLAFAALYDHLLEDDAGPVVRTVSTSTIVDRVAEAHGQSVHETAVGFKYVAAAMAEHDALMGGEESGGFGITAHLRNKDGVLMALLAARAERARSLDDRVDALEAEHGEIHQDRVSVDCPDERKSAVLDAVAADFPDSIAGVAVDSTNTVDGVKVHLDDGTWLLIRPSGTEPKMRVYAGATSDARVADLLVAGRELVEPHV
jgi:phosphomannomutase